MSRRARPFLVLAALVLAGCFGGKTPVTNVWTLPAPRAEAPGVSRDGAALGVARLSSSTELRTTALTHREGDGRQIKRYPYQRWADYPDRMLHERLITRLLAARSFSSVTGVPPKRDLDAILSVRLVEFDEWDEDGSVLVRVGLRWSLENAEGDLLGGELAQSSQEAGSSDAKQIAQVVEAYERATAAVLDEISSRVTELLAVE